jgi:hypothetical protein
MNLMSEHVAPIPITEPISVPKEKSVQEIIDLISGIVEPDWKFNMDDIYGDRGGIPYPKIETLDILYFRKIGTSGYKPKFNYKSNDIIKMLNDLNIGNVKIVKFNSIGKFIEIKLHCYNKRLIDIFNRYNQFKQDNLDKIKSIHEYLGKKISEDFVGWNLMEGFI